MERVLLKLGELTEGVSSLKTAAERLEKKTENLGIEINKINQEIHTVKGGAKVAAGFMGVIGGVVSSFMSRIIHQ